MATNFPTSKDDGTSLPYPAAGNYTNSPSNAGIQDNQNDAIIAIETKLGTGASVPANNKFLVGTGAGTSGWANTVPAGTVVGTSDSQTLTNKTLTSPIINSPNITNATITADALAGYTVSNTGSIYGIGVATGSITSGLTNLTTTGSITAGNSLTVSAGTITAPAGSLSTRALTNPYKFSVYHAPTQTITGGSPQTIKFDTERFDTNNNYSTVTNTYTVPVNGFYMINAQLTFTSVANKYHWIGIAVGGTEVARGQRIVPTNGEIMTVSIAYLLQLTAADAVTIQGDVMSNVTTEITHCWFNGFLVSAT